MENSAESPQLPPTESQVEPPPEARKPPTHIVGIGASAGGLEALERLFRKMPENTGMAFVVVQHLSPDFKSLMDELLARWTKMPIRGVEDRMPVMADEIFLMPPKTEMIISDGKLLLTTRERSDELHLPIDQFFRSLARDCGPRGIAVVLSGTGTDGSRGVRDVHEAGGLVVVQDVETAKFDGMPKSALETGIADSNVAPEEMPEILLHHIQHPRSLRVTEDKPNGMSQIFRMLRDAYGIDFSYYKPTTVTRRTERRLQLIDVANLDEYVDRLREDREELDAMYRDLLIGVTSFFRDAEAFQTLEDQVLPELLEKVPAGEEFRVWVAGCATGEEAYSLAILVHEQIQRIGKPISAKIFATDVHRNSLEFAAIGQYSAEAVASVTPERLKEYFVQSADGYRVAPELRNMVVFAPHNIIKDAPFTRLDLITCRNLLIYLLPNAQKKALCLFHFGLKTGGVLFLGPSESPGDIANEFDVIEQHWKIFRKRRNLRLPADLRLPMSSTVSTRSSGTQPASLGSPEAGLSDVFAEILDLSLPPSVLVDEYLQIVHTFGDAARFLRLRKGMPSLGLLEMLSEELRTAVGGAVHRALRQKQTVAFSGVRTKINGVPTMVSVKINPVPAKRRVGMYLLIQFEDFQQPESGEESTADMNLAQASRDHVESLELELRFTKENLQATIEELETSNEELQATNEELVASNEELQSTNEELHSVNEELYTVNAEYQKKIGELTELTHDMDNLLLSTEVHTIFLDQELCIRKFTPKMAEVFNLIPADVGRKIHGFVHTIHCEGLLDKLDQVLQSKEQHDEEVQNKAGDYFLMRILPYQGDSERSGVVMTLIDITQLKEAEDLFSTAVEAAPNGILMFDHAGTITLANAEIERMFGYQRDELVGQPIEMLMHPPVREGVGKLRDDYLENPEHRPILPKGDILGHCKDGSTIPLEVRLSPIETPGGSEILAGMVDVTHRYKLENSLREQVQQRDRFLATLSHELRNPMGAILTAASMLSRVANERPEVQQSCGVIRRQASRMAALLDDLLDVARVTQGKIKLRMEVIDLVSLCREAIEAVNPLVKARRHEVIFNPPDDPVWVYADRVRVLQIIENLLTNAIKYTQDEGHIEITLAIAEQQAVLRVHDDGCGMSRELLSSIFDMFVQSDDTLDRSEGGMGVGLTLVRSLVELHQGSIEAFSPGLGKGSEFVVRLPLTAKRPESASPTTLVTSSQQIRIVLVEDNDDARVMMESLLRLDGYQVIGSASDGAEGLELIRRYRPDVALMDIGLPGLDGYQVARRVREELGSNIRLIALTGYGRGEDHESVLNAGFDEHLVKPIDIKKLNQVLATLVKRRDANSHHWEI